MGIYGDLNIRNPELRAWIGTLSVDEVTTVNIGGNDIQVNEAMRNILQLQIETFKKISEQQNEDADWRDLQGILSPLFYNAFFKANNNAIRAANYFECLIECSDIETRKKLIKGFDYQEYGQINLSDGESSIGCIGQKSDLIWLVFYDYFINEDDDGSITHTMSNHEEIMSLQLFDVGTQTVDEIYEKVSKILYYCFENLNLRFNLVYLSGSLRDVGESNIYDLQISSENYEYIPLLYANSAMQAKEPRFAFLSYYHVLEYFFNRAQNNYLLDMLKGEGFMTQTPVDHLKLHDCMKKYTSKKSEKESLKLVLTNGVDIDDLRTWLQKFNNAIYTKGEKAVNPADDNAKIISRIAERVYSYRCSIAHAKGDSDEYIAIPEMSNDTISRELPLLKKLSISVLEKYSADMP